MFSFNFGVKFASSLISVSSCTLIGRCILYEWFQNPLNLFIWKIFNIQKNSCKFKVHIFTVFGYRMREQWKRNGSGLRGCPAPASLGPPDVCLVLKWRRTSFLLLVSVHFSSIWKWFLTSGHGKNMSCQFFPCYQRSLYQGPRQFLQPGSERPLGRYPVVSSCSFRQLWASWVSMVMEEGWALQWDVSSVAAERTETATETPGY